MIIRLMGEIDIHSFRADSLLLEQPVISNLKMPDGISDSDMTNWLGWLLDSSYSDDEILTHWAALLEGR